MSKEKPRNRGTEASGKRTGMKQRSGSADPLVQAAIGVRLRSYYEEVAREPIPDRFVELLKQLDGQKPNKS
jgi:hypothetical protein